MHSASAPDGTVAVPVGRPSDAPSPDAPPPRRWYAALDGWRGVAVLAVVAFHTGVLDGGWLGVDLFFVLSGFLITRVVLAGHAESGRVRLGDFWRRRFRRLLPALLLVLVAIGVIVALWPEPERLPSTLLGEAVATLTYVANWFALLATGGYWDQYAVASPLRHMWSLAIEEQFYVVFPLVAAAVLAWRRQSLGWVLSLATLASWTAALVLLGTGAGFERVYLGTDTRLGAITLGAFAGYLTTRPGWLERLQRWALPLAPVAAVAIAALLVLLEGDLAWSAQRWALVLAFELAVVVVLLAAIGAGGWLNRVMAVRLLVFFGAISYGLYLWHIPVQFVVEGVVPGLHPLVLLAVVLTISTLVAWASWRLVETPLRRDGIAALGRLRLPPRLAAGALAGAAVVVTVALVATAAQPARETGSQGLAMTSIAAPGPSAAAGEAQGDGGGVPLSRPEDERPRVLLVGDSMAVTLGEWLLANEASFDVVASATTHVGCGVGGMAPGNDVFDDQVGLSCGRWRATIPDIARSAAPDVTVIAQFASREPEPGVA